MQHPARHFSVAGSLDAWFITAVGFCAGPLQNQQQAIDTALALAAREGGSVTWSDDYVGSHTAHPAPLGWFSDSMRALRGAPPLADVLRGRLALSS